LGIFIAFILGKKNSDLLKYRGKEAIAPASRRDAAQRKMVSEFIVLRDRSYVTLHWKLPMLM